MGSAIAVICGLAAAAMLACGIRAEAKRKAQQQQRQARVDLDAAVDEHDLAQWETEWADWRGAP